MDRMIKLGYFFGFSSGITALFKFFVETNRSFELFDLGIRIVG